MTYTHILRSAKTLALALITLLVTACSTTKSIPDGDQLFTDIKGARRAGVHCIYVDRYAKENRMWYWYPFVRTAEAIILFLQEAIDWVRGKSN